MIKQGSLTLILLLFNLLIVSALPVKVSGTFPGVVNRTVYLMYYSDRIINREEILASALTDSSGKFYLEADLREVQLASIRTGHYSADLYLSPGCDLILESDTLYFNNHYKSFLEYDYLDFDITGKDPDDLNRKIRQLNEVINEFILDNFSGALRRLKRELLDTLKKKTELIEVLGNDFFRIYREYKLAMVETSVYGTGKAELFRKYLFRRDIYYNNPEYMDFFGQYFRNYLLSADQTVQYSDLLYTVNYLGSYKALNDSTGKDTLLRNEVLREVVLLKQLKEWYFNPDFIQDKVLNVIEQIKSGSKFPEHVIIAGNIIHELTLFRRGSPLPWFSLSDLKGKKITPGDLEKKCTFICFVNVESPSSRYELDRLYEFRDKFEGEVNFIIISLDPDKELFTRYSEEHATGCVALYNGDDLPLAFSYKLSTLPVFMLLDEKLEIISYPSAKPSEMVEDQIRFLLNK